MTNNDSARNELAAKIFQELYGKGKQREFGLRKVGKSTYKWSSDFYDMKIIVNSETSAMLYATFRATKKISMIRHFTYSDGNLENVRINT